MKINCKSCGQGHFIPDDSLAGAPQGGLRIRCSKCRAIMAVDRSIARMAGEDTMPDLPTLKRRRSAPAAGVPELTDVRLLDDEDVPLPAVVKGSAVEPLPGVSRDVTGLHLPTGRAARGTRDERVWFAAIGGKARGPYTETEMKDLAARGKVRGRTRVWRPGFDDWMRVRSGRNDLEELAWLRAVVIRRKRAEKEAADRAREKLGVRTLTLESESGPRAAMEHTPPPLPDDEALPAPAYAPTTQHVPEDAVLAAARARRALVPDAAFAPSDPYELLRAPTPVLGTVAEMAFTPSEERAAYGHRHVAKLALMLTLWGALAALLALHALPTLLRFQPVVEGWLGAS